MPSALVSDALVSLSEARAYVLRDPFNADNDILLTTLINAFSKAIPRYCQRQFFPETGGVKQFSYEGGGYLSLSPYELDTLTTITVQQPGLTAAAIDPVDDTNPSGYMLEPQDKTPEGTYLWMRLPEYGRPGAYPSSMGVGYRNTVTITGDWGMSSIPDDAKLACLICIDWRYKNPSGAQSVNVGGLIETGYTRPSDGTTDIFPPEAMGYLELLRRPDLGV